MKNKDNTGSSEWEESFDRLIPYLRPSNLGDAKKQHESIKDFIRNVLSIQAKRHREEMLKLEQGLFKIHTKHYLKLKQQHREELESKVKKMIDENEKNGWRAAYASGSDAGAGYTIGYKAALEDLLNRTEEEDEK